MATWFDFKWSFSYLYNVFTAEYDRLEGNRGKTIKPMNSESYFHSQIHVMCNSIRDICTSLTVYTNLKRAQVDLDAIM